ncbi:MAG: rod shape-determining protein MreC [Chloroflexi bacterium]|nr:rod shape-determining protein MreC [Chloroflexota bacterium]
MVKHLPTRSTVLIILILLSLAGVVLDQNDDLQPIEDLALRLVVPIQAKLTAVANSVSDLTQTTRDIRELRRSNEELQGLADSLMIENVRLKEIGSENETLRRLLGFTQANPTHSYKAAEVKGRVIGRDPSNFLSYLIVDVGSQQGIERGMPVVTERGLVGRITEVGSNWAKVMLIIDPSSSVNALIQNSRATGVVEGRVGGGLVMKYIPQADTVNVNDIVLTSGLGGNFPKALIIGQVTAVHQRDIEMFQQAVIRPTVDFNNLEIVLVITNFLPTDFERLVP